MKIVIDIPEEMHKAFEDEMWCGNLTIGKAIANGTPLPDNATNGDVLMTLFPTFKAGEINSDTVVLEQCYPLPTCIMQFNRKWWNTPYKDKERRFNMMTREEAIEYTNAQLDEAVDDAEAMDDEMYEALQVLVKIAEQEPCEDCISKRAVAKLAKKMYLEVANMNIDAFSKSDMQSLVASKCRQFIDKELITLPPVQPEEKVGEWIDDDESDFYKKCSLCGVEIDIDFYEETQMNYCPNCGAKMKGEKE